MALTKPRSEGTSPNLEEKRAILFASLLRCAPETGSLRDRAVDRMVLWALLGSTSGQPFKMGKVQQNLQSAGGGAVDLRVDVVKASLERLLGEQRIGEAEVLKKRAYFLTPASEQELAKAIDSAERLFDAVVVHMLLDTEHLISRDQAAKICKTFICRAFAKFGARLARMVTGDAAGEELLSRYDIHATFNESIGSVELSEEARRSVEARCVRFLRSKDPADERLKFYLTQSYYLAQLIGLKDRSFDPLVTEAFSGSVFFLDTNVVLPRMLSASDAGKLFDEMLRVAQRLGIDVRVTRATINEARRVAADRLDAIRQIVSTVPGKLAEQTRDSFLQAYLAAREVNPDLTPEAFFEPFDRMPEILEQGLGITFEDRVEDEMLRGRDFTAVEKRFNEEAIAVRKFAKGEPVLRHDVAHYALVSDQRAMNAKTWFLTRDRSLAQAAAKLSPTHVPFCFSLIGFLQSISPFCSAAEEQSLADVFATFVGEEVVPVDGLFDIQEMKLIGEMHADVMCTNEEQILPAFDYVKKGVLRGAPYSSQDAPRVALGLRKFFASSADEKRRLLEAETRRLEELANAEKRTSEGERELRQSAERDAATERARREQVDEELANTRLEAGNRARGEQEALERVERHRQRERLFIGIVGVVSGVLLWHFAPSILGALNERWPQFIGRYSHERIVFGLSAALVFCLPSVPYLRNTRWRPEVRGAVFTALVSAAFGLAKVIDDNTWSIWSAYVQIAGLLTPLALFWTAIARDQRE